MIVQCEQGSAAWFANRSGRVTGSKMAAVMNFKNNGEESAERANYKAQIVCEILTGQPDLDGYVSPYMKWGNEQEPFARNAYELQEGLLVDQVGFVLHPTVQRMGGSPDGLVGADGLVEFKCPKTATHICWILEGKVPEEHIPQMNFYLACTGRKWCDFASFDPRLPEPLQLLVIRLERDEEQIAFIEAHVRQFLDEVDRMISSLKAIVGDFPMGNPEPAQPEEDPLGITQADIDEIEAEFKSAQDHN
jgi:YqaJ-like recombinase protein